MAEGDFLVPKAAGERRPYHYTRGAGTNDNSLQVNVTTSNNEIDQWSERANYSRYLYYSRLRREMNPADDILLIPPHCIPNDFFYPNFITSVDGKQGSIVTIFALWNTMMGTSLLSMPWAMENAGAVPAVVLLTVVAGISFYTAYRILEVYESNASSSMTDLAVLCKRLLGRWAQWLAVIFSALILLGASIVYWILLSNFLFHTVDYMHSVIVHDNSTIVGNATDFYCPDDSPTTDTDPDSEQDTFHKYWALHRTVPLFLVIILGPIACIRSPTFFTKFNSLGTLSVLYLAVFVFSKWSKYGINVTFTDTTSPIYIPLWKDSFPALAGMLSMAFFIHNCLVTIMKNNRVKRNNRRDLGIAFIFVALTYFIIGGVFYLIFPLDKNCIQDNFLNNFHSFDVWAFTARIFLFFQILSVFPLIVYILRVQVIYAVTKKEPNMVQTVVSNSVIITICVCFAIFLPHIGSIIRFSGAFCGLVYLFFLPICLYLRWQQNMNTLTNSSMFWHILLLLVGLSNFILQFTFSE
ncbi:unnamed protein product [Orchesella dallaii]|uniref:Amino acid transporter transmembrane domain-containing protein n=1 Tax=Orchesella dallaii TaxID=48710 RepID=A0ABP1PQC8_9HEXA